MKYLFGFLLSLSFVGNVHGQQCKSLLNKRFFHRISLGDQLPIELIDCSKSRPIAYSNYTDYNLKYDSLNLQCKKKYADFFKFLNTRFSFSTISTNKSGQIIFIGLHTFFDDEHRADSVISSPPGNFNTLYNQLVALYGKPTTIENGRVGDLAEVKAVGISKLIIWECDNVYLRLRLNYGARTKELNVLNIEFQTELIEEVLSM